MKAHLFDSSVYKQRREQLKSTLKHGKILFLGNKEASMNFKDNWYSFRQDSSFLYYFGIDIPDLAAIIDIDENDEILFGDDPSIDHIVWTGPLVELQELASCIGVSKVLSYSKLKEHVSSSCNFLPPYRPEHILALHELTGIPCNEIIQQASIRLVTAIVSQRSIKGSEEIEELDQAASLSHKMHLAIMKAAKPGMKEFELVGLASKFVHENNSSFSFPPILTTHGEILHNHNYSNTLRPGGMVLFDGGCESKGCYAGDITRSFPVSGEFDARQKEIYNIVYDAYEAARTMLRPGVRFLDVHLRACLTLSAGLQNLGLIRCSPEEAVAEGVHSLFFQCGLGHMLGLDVHDMENLGEDYVGYSPQIKRNPAFGFKSLRLARELEEGFVVTVEPGIYIIPHLIDLCRSKGLYEGLVNYQLLETYKDFGGIRIEDDFVINSTSGRMLGSNLAIKLSDIEEIRRINSL